MATGRSIPTRPKTPKVIRPEYLQRIAEFKFIPPASVARTILTHPEKYASSLKWRRWMKLAPKLSQRICITAATLYANHYTLASMARESYLLFGERLSENLLRRAVTLVLLGPRPIPPKLGRPSTYKKAPKVQKIRKPRASRHTLSRERY